MNISRDFVASNRLKYLISVTLFCSVLQLELNSNIYPLCLPHHHVGIVGFHNLSSFRPPHRAPFFAPVWDLNRLRWGNLKRRLSMRIRFSLRPKPHPPQWNNGREVESGGHAQDRRIIVLIQQGFILEKSSQLTPTMRRGSSGHSKFIYPQEMFHSRQNPHI